MQKDFLYFLYHTKLGRGILWILKRRWLSILIGFILNQRISKIFIKPFVKKNNINLDDFETNYHSFNDFFTRKIKPGKRRVDMNMESFIAPCDAYLTVYPIKEGLVLPVKQSYYSITSLLKNEKLAQKYENGLCLVFRLGVNHYHRYCYIDNGTKGNNIKIKGFLHTVRPVALASIPVFTENSREYTVLNTNNFGKVIQIEVGALLVGKIKNFQEEGKINKGEEKGMFLFGGSTIILLVEKDKIVINEKFDNAKEEIEVKMGEVIAFKHY